MFSPREATLRLAVLLRCWCSHHNNVRTVREGRHVCYCEVCAPVSSFPCFINSVVDVSRMSDHERGLEDDEEETTPTAKRPKFDETESRVWPSPGHVRFTTPKKATLALLKSTPSLFVAPPTENTLGSGTTTRAVTPKVQRGFHTRLCASARKSRRT